MFEHLVEIPDSASVFRQGDIFKDILFTAVDQKLLGVLVTPECDIFQEKTPYFHFCALIPFHALLFNIGKTNREDFLELNPESDKGKTKGIKQETIGALLNNKFPQYQWLGKFEGREEYWVVDFNLMECVNKGNVEISLKEKHLYRIKSPLNEAVFVRNGAFMSRVSLPECIDRDIYIDKVFLSTQGILTN